jgi:hypothetical protein
MTRDCLARLIELAEARGRWSSAPEEQPAAEAAEYERLWAEFVAWTPAPPVSRAQRGRSK